MATLGNYIKIKHGYAFKGDYISTEDNGIVLVTPGNFNIGGGFKEQKCKFFTSDYPQEYVLKEDDLIVTMTDLSKAVDTLGYSALVPESEERIYLHNQRIGLVQILNDNIDKHFLYWFMRTPSYQKRIAATSTGSTVHHTSPDRIGEVEIDIPELEVQKRIANCMDVIDQKIRINEEINRNLQEQAHQIFKREFLELDEVPNGWKEGSLVDIADYLNGLAMQKFRPKDDEIGLPVLKIKELRQGACDTSSEQCSPTIKKEYIIHDGDVIFSWSGSLLVDFWCGGDCGLNQHLFKVTSFKYDKWFYYAWTMHHLERFIAVAADKATTMGHIKREELSKAEVLIPNKADYERIGALLEPIYNMIINNRIENRKLASIRDELLPKLMSGEIDVTELDV
ncbi:MAG: restriction endonuclease subunit S [Lachnospiraceae bacterium]|nr:restriction endonuclease subunit S [Lachnospiraceae bacterium]